MEQCIPFFRVSRSSQLTSSCRNQVETEDGKMTLSMQIAIYLLEYVFIPLRSFLNTMQIVSTQFLHFVSALLFFYTTLDEQLLLLCHRNFKQERMCFFFVFCFCMHTRGNDMEQSILSSRIIDFSLGKELISLLLKLQLFDQGMHPGWYCMCILSATVRGLGACVRFCAM